ncbi:bifunctional demethylmenaquinone methyltransferase/2-methoxy-6-polyprenyl-1,4-benzoquinol methylase UbiE [Halothiobacillus sp. DCM-1]|uniref:bifunctional demethylmenaquinone methyltransferase/2-methoxy-6-polyprenyl-1,4-benzoquinol methylase UbiE n=1 Tax=Halothiobacillus sp. DCM-1 TaxID=3112558 RepID=UPI0032475505
MTEHTHFGYQQVPAEEKVRLVGRVFDSVASRYDVMNDAMSFGIHRIWKRIALEHTGLRPGMRVLDLASGTGDLALKMAGMVGSQGLVILSDINANMLAEGRSKLDNAGILNNVGYVLANAQYLPFPSNHFDCITIGFGLRNVTDKAIALREMARSIKPGGRVVVLEFSKPISPMISKAYDFYSFTALPTLGKLIAKDADSYRYLAESIRMHPDQAALKSMMLESGFDQVDVVNLSLGVVALHIGYKF